MHVSKTCLVKKPQSFAWLLIKLKINCMLKVEFLIVEIFCAFLLYCHTQGDDCFLIIFWGQPILDKAESSSNINEKA